mmetsp:Transcript_11186/g.41864  ORF Transcript_11186/g.41864 Transcript_11186/m.41864 type:complete len:189 (+) Transcript_11186:399-965(+)
MPSSRRKATKKLINYNDDDYLNEEILRFEEEDTLLEYMRMIEAMERREKGKLAGISAAASNERDFHEQNGGTQKRHQANEDRGTIATHGTLDVASNGFITPNDDIHHCHHASSIAPQQTHISSSPASSLHNHNQHHYNDIDDDDYVLSPNVHDGSMDEHDVLMECVPEDAPWQTAKKSSECFNSFPIS